MPNINFEDRLLERGKQVLTEAVEQVEITPLSAGSSPSGSLTIVDTDNQHKGLKLELSLPKGDTGSQGPQGPEGPKGKNFTYNDFTPSQLENLKVKGDKGEPGKDGYSPQVAVDPIVEILAPEAQAYVEDLNPDLNDALLKFHLPRGTRGATGRGARLGIDNIYTLPEGDPLEYSTRQEYNAEEDLNITYLTLGMPSGKTGPQGPKGDKGEQGEQGPQGPQGEPGIVSWDDNVPPLPYLPLSGGTLTGHLEGTDATFNNVQVGESNQKYLTINNTSIKFVTPSGNIPFDVTSRVYDDMAILSLDGGVGRIFASTSSQNTSTISIHGTAGRKEHDTNEIGEVSLYATGPKGNQAIVHLESGTSDRSSYVRTDSDCVDIYATEHLWVNMPNSGSGTSGSVFEIQSNGLVSSEDTRKVNVRCGLLAIDGHMDIYGSLSIQRGKLYCNDDIHLYNNSKVVYPTQGSNLFLASPSSGSGTPDFRSIDVSDIPTLPYLPLTGGTLTGQLNGTTAVFSGNVEGDKLTFGKGETGTRYYLVAKTPSRNSHVLWAGGGAKADGNVNGTVVGLGAGGLTIVGGGEYAVNRYGLADLNDGDEYLYLGSDNELYIESNAATIANRHTMTYDKSGNLFIKGVAGHRIDNRNEIVDMTLANNGVSSAMYPAFLMSDVDGRIMSRFESTVNPNGNHGFYCYARNYDANGTAVKQVGIGPTIAKDGTATWRVDEPSAFRTALELGALALGTASQEGALDCDALPTGIHYVNSYGTNTPVSGVGGMCVCVKVATGTQAVQAFVTNNANTPLHVRRYSSNAWTAWRQVG